MVAGVVFKIFGPSKEALQLATVLLSAVVAVLLWRIGCKLGRPRAGLIAGALFWVWPPAYVWWAIKPGSNYFASLSLALAATLCLIHIWRHDGGVRAFALYGLFVGLSWWGNPATMAILVPASIAAIPKLLKRWKLLPLSATFALVGSTPWIVYNLKHDFASLDAPDSMLTYPERLAQLFEKALPMGVGVRVPFHGDWLIPSALYLALGILVVAFAAWCTRRDTALRFVGFVAITAPLIVAISPRSDYVDNPRHIIWAIAIVTLAFALLLDRLDQRLALIICVGLAVMSFDGLRKFGVVPTAGVNAPDITTPPDLIDAKTLLLDSGSKTAFADYWLSYKLTFEMDERVIVVPTYDGRYAKFDQEARRQPPVFLFLMQSVTFERMQTWCNDTPGANCTYEKRGAFALVRPALDVAPEQMPFPWT